MPWSSFSGLLWIVGIMIAYVGTLSQMCYIEASKAPFAFVGLSTKVFGARIFGFRAQCVKTRSNLGRGQCFWRAVSSSQNAWRRVKQHSLACLLPSKAQLHPGAWASPVQIASYAEVYKVRVILLTLDHQRVLHFVPTEFSLTITSRGLLASLAEPIRLGSFFLLISVVVVEDFLKKWFHTLELLLLFMLGFPIMGFLISPRALAMRLLRPCHAFLVGDPSCLLGQPLECFLLMSVITDSTSKPNMGTLSMTMMIGCQSTGILFGTDLLLLHLLPLLTRNPNWGDLTVTSCAASFC